MARTGENIYKRKDGRWEARYISCYDGVGKAHYVSLYAKTYREVKDKLLQAQTETLFQTDISTRRSKCCGEWLDAWLQFKKARVKESTYIKYLNLINWHIRPHLSRYPIAKISTAQIETYLSALMEHGRLDGSGGLSPKSVSDVLTVLKSVFAYAESYGEKIVCSFKHLSIEQKPQKLRVLTLREESRLTSVLLSETDTVKAGVLLALYTGIRIGELCALTWADISLSEKTVYIHQTLQRLQSSAPRSDHKTHLIKTTPKSDCSIREIPLQDFLIPIITPMKNAPQAYFLTGNEKCMEPRVLQNRFKTYLKIAEIQNTNFHILRHTFATRCVEVGCDIKSLSEILGHSSVKITLDRYVHTSLQQKRNNMARLSLPPR